MSESITCVGVTVLPGDELAAAKCYRFSMITVHLFQLLLVINERWGSSFSFLFPLSVF